ncbi:hypothetical protein ARMSODRAFT_958104 [Armillaria solidipes]|uniref:Uncharacterized protein n=1 Tax=Armillaria solidipes TaxID=1076256 RepID=A0A2H3BHJ3_9AGAR|nr:hypothetical protein ARMSODRAFT_958104 [Armillaria solidipes]
MIRICRLHHSSLQHYEALNTPLSHSPFSVILEGSPWERTTDPERQESEMNE